MTGLTQGQAVWREYRLVFFMTLAAGLAGLLAALVVSVWQTPLYRASASVSLRAAVADLGVAEAADRLAGNTAAWVESETFAARLTREELGGLTPRAVADKTAARALPKEMRVVIEFEDEIAGRAADVVDGLARVAVAAARAELEGDGLEIAEIGQARVPGSPISPRPVLAALVGLVLGMMAGLLLGLVYRWSREPVGTTA